MRKQAFVLIGVVCLLCAGVLFAGSVTAQSSAYLEIQAADDDDTDSETVTFTFRTADNATTASISPTRDSEDGGSVEFEFQEWSESGGFQSGTGTSFSVDGNTRYEVTYQVEADSSASEGTYSITSSVDIRYDDKPSEVASSRLSATVEVLEPEMGRISDTAQRWKFTPEDDGELTRSVSFNIQNTGDGLMDVEDVSLSGIPSGMSAEVTSIPDEIRARESDSGQIQVSADDSISEGRQTFTATVTDSEDNSESFTVEIEILKPPAAGVTTSSVDLGEILVGEDASTEFTLTERNGYEDISGIDASILTAESQGSISFPQIDSRSIQSDGSSSQDVVVQVDGDAEQGKELEWIVEYSPRDRSGIATDKRVTFTADVIYPPYYEELSMTDANFTFDEPRQVKDEFNQEVTVDIANGGDLDMEIQDISATVPGNPDVDVVVDDAPDVVPPRTSETITLDVQASSAASEGNWEIDLETTVNEPTTVSGVETGTATIESSITIEHETELRVSQDVIDTGEIIVTESASGQTTIREHLGYQPVEDFSLEQVSGPENGWLTIVEQPESLSAGENGEFSVNIQFDTSAELYTTYEWVFEVSGANIDTKTITVEAVPEPVDFGETIEELEQISSEVDGDSQDIALEMADTLDTLEEMLQRGDSDATRGDITVLVSAGRSSILLLDGLDSATQRIENGNHAEAQEDLVRATAAFNTLSLAAEDVTSSELQSRTVSIRDTADSAIADLIEAQESHFLEQLESSETTMLQRAQTQRELARLAELSGDNERAAELRSEAESAFSTYSELISNGNENLISARQEREELDNDLFFSIGGIRAFWIGSLSAYNTKSTDILESYDTAVEQFEEAGATERAETAAAEQADLRSSYQTAYRVSLVIGAIFGILLFVLLLWEIRALYRYRLDSEDAVSGDFLLPWDETQ